MSELKVAEAIALLEKPGLHGLVGKETSSAIKMAVGALHRTKPIRVLTVEEAQTRMDDPVWCESHIFTGWAFNVGVNKSIHMIRMSTGQYYQPNIKNYGKTYRLYNHKPK